MRNAVQQRLAANILLMRKGNRAFLLLEIASLPNNIHWKKKLGDRMIKQLLNSVVAKYRDLSVSHRSIICLSLRLRQIIDLLATDKSRYFAQPRPIIVYCRDHSVNNVNYMYMSIFAMNLLFNHSFLSTYMSLKHQMLQTTKMKFGKLLGWQISKGTNAIVFKFLH